jgi:predicted nicotinamide N-methyase
MSPLRIRYHTYEIDKLDIHVRSLRDKQQFSDTLGEAESLGISSAQWPIFGVVWESSQILAHEMAGFSIKGKRILEIGCGMALSSLLLNARHADITATDIHPEAGNFLAENTRLNEGQKIPFLRTDWKDDSHGLGKFDLIIGSDLLYEKEHIDLLATFINKHANARCEIVIVDPGRSNHASFSKRMITLGYSHTQNQSTHTEQITGIFKGHILHYQRQLNS